MHPTNREAERSGVENVYFGAGVFVWPPNLYFYEWCSEEDWLEGIFEWE